jgi:pentatricopeptide repeat protein
MHFLCQRSQVDKAFELFERMRKQDIAADTVVYNILISGLCRDERVTEAFDLFKPMTSEGCCPNSGTYQVLLDGLIGLGDFLKPKALFAL